MDILRRLTSHATPATVPATPTGDAVLIDLSDLHSGSSLALWHPDVYLPKGVKNELSATQLWLWDEWLAFVGWQTKMSVGRRRILVLDGDLVQGIRDPFAQMETNLPEFQQRNAVALIDMLKQKGDTIIVIRGTPRHDGPEGTDADAIAKDLGCPEHSGQYSTNFAEFSINGIPINVTHHVSTSRSPVSKMTGLMSALAMTNAERGQWERSRPDILLRGHRHEYDMIHQGGPRQGQAVITTPCWCAKGEFAVKVSPNTIAHVGGVVIPIDADGTWWARPRFTAIPCEEDVKP